jgi:hypothetical protein
MVLQTVSEAIRIAPTKLKRRKVLDLFGGREEFVRFHFTNPVLRDEDGGMD